MSYQIMVLGGGCKFGMYNGGGGVEERLFASGWLSSE